MEGGNAASQAKAVLGPKITVTPVEFLKVVARMDKPVIVVSRPAGLGFSRTWQYLTSYKGFLFHTISKSELYFESCELYETRKMT
ncbi:MAG: hypothetical protein ABSF83_15870 [Nitrososphaerales archaeon]